MDCFSSYDRRFCGLPRRGKDKKYGGKRGKTVKLSTDAQSVAARERRHRISERFKILRSLVPGGSKMDTVSMLEEAIHYVKFLKTQIWLHQSMIHYSVDGCSSLFHPPTSLHAKPTNDLCAQIYNMGCTTHAFAAIPQCDQENIPHEETWLY